MILYNFILAITLLFTSSCDEKLVILNEINNDEMNYYMPSEEEEHEGTWLQWPHNNGWDPIHTNRYDNIWVEMTNALHLGENVHIIAYDDYEQNRVIELLKNSNINMDKIDFLIAKTDDVWIRDNGPIFVYDENDNLTITNWGFNGWGNKADYLNCNIIPKKVSDEIGLPIVNVDMINEGGSVELDGKGTLMAKRSSILNDNRNPGLTQENAEEFFSKYLGVSNFIWLDGNINNKDITDDHIDGTAKFANGNTIVTYSRENSYSGEYEILENARNKDGELYNIVELPITPNKIRGAGLEGTYINYYVANEVVIVPNFNKPTDVEANSIIQSLYPSKRVVGINITELYKDGGALHCVTQQQPK